MCRAGRMFAPLKTWRKWHRMCNVNQRRYATKDAIEILKRLGAFEDVKRVYATRRNRAGRGKTRGRKHVQKLGPLVVYKNDNGVVRGFRNIPGVELMNVNAMNILRLAPGGHVGRFVIFTENAFNELNSIY